MAAKPASAKSKWRVSLFFAVERLLKNKSLVGNHRFYDADQFPWVRIAEAAHGDVRAELDDILRARDAIPNFQDISVDQAAVTRDDRWKTFFFQAYGRKFEQNRALCPKTAAMLDRIPGVTTAFFSILMPQKKIPSHRGPYAGVLRYHLGVMVPKPETLCGITVGGETCHWTEGRSLVFDDTYLHNAWNQSDEIRVVLFLDVLRPLPFPYSLLNRLMLGLVALSPWIKDSTRRQRDWDKVFQEAYNKVNR